MASKHVRSTLPAWLAVGAASFAAQAVADVGPLALDFTELLRGRNILFVGAHPDDELGFAPMLAEACADPDAEPRN